MRVFYHLCFCAIILSVLFVAPQTGNAKIWYEDTKGLDIVDGKTFKNLSGNTIDLGVVNPILTIPSYNLIRNYMELPPADPEHAAIRSLANSLFRSVRPQDTSDPEPSTRVHNLPYYFTPDMVGTLLAIYLLEDPANDLSVNPKLGNKEISDRKKEVEELKKNLVIKFFLSRQDFKERLAPQRVVVCGGGTSTAFDAAKKTDICDETNFTALSGQEIYPLLSSAFKDNLNQAVGIFASKPDLTKVKLLISVLWYQISDKTKYWDFFSAIESTLANQGVKILPDDKQAWLDQKWKFEEVSEIDYAIDEKLYSKFVVKALLDAAGRPKLLEDATYSYTPNEWPDCCARSIKNFIMINYSDPLSDPDNPEIDVDKLERIGASEDVVDFFIEYTTRNEFDTQEARDKWGYIQSNLTGVEYIKGGELAAGADNMFTAVSALLFANAKTKPTDWEELVTAIDPKGTVKPGREDVMNFEMSSSKFYWETSDLHFTVQYLASSEKHNLWPAIEQNKDILQSPLSAGDLASFSKLKWVELAQRLDPAATTDFIFTLSENRNLYYYFLNIGTGEQIEKIASKIDASEKKFLTYLLNRAFTIPDTIRRIVANAAVAKDTKKLEQAIEYVSFINFDPIHGFYSAFGHIGAENNAEILNLIAQKIGTLKRLKRLNIWHLKSKNVYMPISGTSPSIQVQDFLYLLFKNLPANQSISELNLSTESYYSSEEKALIENMDDGLYAHIQKSLTSFFSANKSLEKIQIEDFPVTDDLLASIGTFPLKELLLASAAMTDAQIEILAKGISKNNSLHRLAIVNTDMTDAGVKYIDDYILKDNSTIQSIYLDGNKGITEAGIKILEDRYLANTNIESISVNDSFGSYDYRYPTPRNQAAAGIMTRPRALWSPINNGYLYMGLRTWRRPYSTVAYNGPVRLTRPAYRALGNRPNVTYGRPLFIFSQNRQFMTAMPNSLVRMQPSQPAFFTKQRMIPWNAPQQPSVWTSASWRQFVNGMKRFVK
ncbi:MAG: hypothetical protein CMN56_10285 [Sneathiella sp.]|uniref:hypothetical protein n=1 Tax=Sneathiella sp. TaxID=1964365 RepID=UPI000C48C60D|nr:hypothetical protein [Sneathiella sp.]MAZ03516.1 hypothetical protein [Sneathiella sp.]